MTYEELVQEAKKIYEPADASSFKEHVAYQFNIKGEAEGAFYLEVSDGKVHVEPYEYFDRDVLFTTTVETLMKIGNGKLDPVFAYTTGKLKVEGNIEKALLLKNLSGSKQAEKGEEAAGTKQEPCREDQAEGVTEPCKEAQAASVTEPGKVPAEEKTELLNGSPAETSSAPAEAGSVTPQAGKDASKWPNRKKKKK